MTKLAEAWRDHGPAHNGKENQSGQKDGGRPDEVGGIFPSLLQIGLVSRG